jgi:hypothetical protein
LGFTQKALTPFFISAFVSLAQPISGAGGAVRPESVAAAFFAAQTKESKHEQSYV